MLRYHLGLLSLEINSDAGLPAFLPSAGVDSNGNYAFANPTSIRLEFGDINVEVDWVWVLLMLSRRLTYKPRLLRLEVDSFYLYFLFDVIAALTANCCKGISLLRPQAHRILILRPHPE